MLLVLPSGRAGPAVCPAPDGPSATLPRRWPSPRLVPIQQVDVKRTAGGLWTVPTADDMPSPSLSQAILVLDAAQRAAASLFSLTLVTFWPRPQFLRCSRWHRLSRILLDLPR